MSDLFTPESILEAAASAAGTDDFGDPIYRPALDVLIRSIKEEAQVDEQHYFLAAMQMTQRLVVRARVAALLKKHPEILDVPIREPLFILGMPRTGTTMLHNLLAGHPDHRAPKLWELRSVTPPNDAGPEWEQDAIAETQSVLDLLYGTRPEFAAIHPMRPTWPDECSWLFRSSFATMIYAFTYHVPGYIQWLTSTEMEPYYAFYKTLLQILQWGRRERRLVLKDPCHLFHLGALLHVFPDAHVVQTHRRMDEALPSFASLIYSLRFVHGAQPEAAAMGDEVMNLAEQGVYPTMWLRQVLPSRRIIDAPYRKLVSDPIEGARAICEAIGSTTDAASVAAMGAWLTENHQNKAGRHAYTLEQFGLDQQAVTDRFERYHERALPEETIREV